MSWENHSFGVEGNTIDVAFSYGHEWIHGSLSSGSVECLPTAIMPAERPKNLMGLNFKRWQQKMLFNLTTIGLARFLTYDLPTSREEETDPQVLMAFNAWKDSDYLCQKYVKNSLNDSLYNVHTSKSSSKELWDSLGWKYKTEDTSLKKYIVGRFFEFQMVDSKNRGESSARAATYHPRESLRRDDH